MKIAKMVCCPLYALPNNEHQTKTKGTIAGRLYKRGMAICTD